MECVALVYTDNNVTAHIDQGHACTYLLLATCSLKVSRYLSTYIDKFGRLLSTHLYLSISAYNVYLPILRLGASVFKLAKLDNGSWSL